MRYTAPVYQYRQRIRRSHSHTTRNPFTSDPFMHADKISPSIAGIFLSIASFGWFTPWPRNASLLLLLLPAVLLARLFIQHVLPLWLARGPLRRGNYGQVLRRLGFLHRLRLGGPLVLHLKGAALMFAGRDVEAEAVLRECLRVSQSPEQKSFPMVNLGYVLLGQRRYEEAAQALDEAIKLRPNGAVAYSTRAEIYLWQGMEPQKALELLDRGIEHKRASDIQSQRDLHMFGYLAANRAWALFLLGQPARAESALEKAEEIVPAAVREFKPGAAGIHYHIGRALLAGKQVPRAIEHFRQARTLAPEGRYATLSEAALREHGG
jgi:tetratricopeptide (TPR) repeat protein